MRSTSNRGTRGHLSIIAILQVLMLVSTLVLTPTLVIAQEDTAAESAQQSQLYIHPDPLKLTVGDIKVVTAWSCPAGIPLPLGVDEDPTNANCQPVQAEWSLNDAAAGVASLAIDEDETGRRTRVTANAAGGGDGNTKIIATLGDLTYKAELILKAPEPTADELAAKQAEEEAAAQAAEEAAKAERQAQKAAEEEAAAQAAEEAAKAERQAQKAAEEEAAAQAAEEAAKAERQAQKAAEEEAAAQAAEEAAKAERQAQKAAEEEAAAQAAEEAAKAERQAQKAAEEEAAAQAAEEAAKAERQAQKAAEEEAAAQAAEEAPSLAPEPVVEEAPSLAPEPVVEEAPSLAPEPVVEEAPSLAPEPVVEEAPSLAPEPVVEEAPSLAPEPVVEEAPSLAPEPVVEEAPSLAPVVDSYPGERFGYIVDFAPGTDLAIQDALLAGVGATVSDRIPALSMVSASLSADAAAALRLDSAVVRVELDKVRAAEAQPSDPDYASQWGLDIIGWQKVYTDNSPAGSAVVAVLDTGVDAGHPDLAGQLVAGASFVEGASATADPSGHGTAMAGIVAAATDNGTGIAGVGFRGVSIMPVTVLGPDATGRDSDIIAGIVHATDAGADVILMAFSSSQASPSLQLAIDYAWDRGVVLVASVGNDGSAANSYPAGDAGVMGVAATNQADQPAAFSNSGASVFMAAPGADILTLAPGGATVGVQGTSASAAFVAGAAALLIADEGLSNASVAGRLAATAQAVGSADTTGNGRLALARAFNRDIGDSLKPAGAPGGGPYSGPFTPPADGQGPVYEADLVGTIEAQMANHEPTPGNCIFYDDQDGILQQTVFTNSTTPQPVTGTTGTAWTAHGRSGNNCPANLSLGTQSAVGFNPIAVNSNIPVNGSTFLVGRWTHHNNPINSNTNDYTGDLNIRLFGQNPPLHYDWQLTETPNNCNNGPNQPPGTDCSDDFTWFDSQLPAQDITVGNLTYKLVILGFVTDADGSCPATSNGPFAGGTAASKFRTVEGTETYGCMYAQLAQERPLTVNKVSESGQGSGPNFAFSSTSALGNTPWTAWSDNLVPNGAGRTATILVGQTVVITEADPTPLGWQFVGASCKDGAQAVVPASLQGRQLTLTPSEATSAGSLPITCTFTNRPIAPKLTVIKHVINDNGGTALASAFSMTVDDPGTNPASFPGAESPGTTVTVDPGAYSVSETGPSGYAASYSADCTGTLAIGETKTCTVTNNDIAPGLTVIKHVINDNGGTALASAFSMTVDDPGTNPASFPGAESPGTTVTVDPGAYSVSETGPSGYAASYSADCTGTLAIGETKTCTVTNNDIAPGLTVIKHVINDNGGTALASAFSMTVDDPGTNPASFPGAESPGTTVTVDPGAYSVSETGPSGYAASYSADCTGTLAIGETKTCTVTNNDIAPGLTVIKHVINDNGGTALASAFSMTVDDPGTNPASFPGAESPGTTVTVDPGAYSVSETGPSGYAASYSADCTGTLAIGETKTCTVTNNDIAPGLTVIKHVINDNGGTALASAFSMTVDDPGTNPASFPGAESPGTTVTVDPGAYSVSETGPSGYAASYSADCTGTLAIGETKTCTVTNNDIAPGLTVIKHVINDNGGTALASAFSMTVDDPGTNPASFPGAESPGTTVTVDPGAYSVSETGPSGYAASYSADCTGTLAIGETKTCTVTNNDIAPGLTVIKHVINDNGGTALASAFSMTVDDPGTNPASFPGAESPGTTVTVDPGAYSVSETGPSGYAASYSADCTGTLAIGETKTCTVTNNDIAPGLTVIKHVINDNGGTALASAFSMTVDDPGTNPASFPGAESPGTTVTVDPGAYSVSETGPSGYAASYSADCTGTLAIGETKTCTVTNNDIAPGLTVIKHVINDNGGTALASAFSMTVDDPGTNPASFPGAESPGTTVTVDPGAYSVSETGPSGYAASYSADCTGTLAIGETKTCTVTNNDIAPGLTVIKHVINDNGGTALASAFSMTVDDPGTNPASFPGAESPGTTVTVDPGAYSVSETGPSGYAASYSADCTGTLAIGETKTCTVTNNDQQAYITVVKEVTNNNGGSAVADDFLLTLDGTPVLSGVAVPVNPDTYTASETLLPGYTFTGFSDDCNAQGDITVALGESKTCTITNDDQQAYITVVKEVTNNNGGSAVADDFLLTLDGTPVLSGVAVPVNPDTYTASETLLPGYTFTGFSDDCNAQGDITVALGESKTCTITNNDNPVDLTIDKTVKTAPSFAAGFWTVVYEVKVKNFGPWATTYDLTDTPTFGPNVTVENVAVTSLDTALPVNIGDYDWATPALIVDDEPIGVSETDTFAVTVTFSVAGSASSSDLDCEVIEEGEGTGTLNTATASYDGSTIQDTDCAPVPKVTIDKTVTNAPSFAAGFWTVTYKVDVANVGPIATTYDLTDTPTFGPNVTVENVAVTSLDTSLPVNIGDYDWATPALIVDDEPIGVSETDTFAVTVTFTVAGTATSANLDCQLVTGENGTGTLNTATASFNGSTIQDTDCAPVPKVTIDKTVTNAPSFAAGFWTVTYKVDVANVGPIATTYDLTDTPTFGPNVTVTNIAVSATTPAVNKNPYTAGSLIVDDQSIGVGVTHTYTVTVTFTVAGTATSANLDCQLVTGENGTGTLNTATASYDGSTIQDTDCAPVPKVTIDKTVTNAPSFAAGFWTVTYKVDVANVGPIATTYDLTDTPTFGPNVTVTNIAVSATTPAVNKNPYTAGSLIVDDQSIGVGVTHTYTVTVTFTVAGTATSANLDCQLVTGENGTGTLNTATASYDGSTIQDTDCAPVPKVTIIKTVTNAPSFAAGFWTVTYKVDVANVGPIATTYDLTDTPTFGPNVTVTNIAVSATTPAVNKNPYTAGSLIVDDQSIGVGVTHTYTVTVTFTVAGTATSANLDCQLVTGENGTGTLNTATASYDGSTIQDTDCAPVPKLTIIKEVAGADGVVATADGAGTAAYDIDVTNVGPISTTYDLSDVPTFGAGTEVTKISVSAATPSVDIKKYTAGSLIVDNQSIDPGVTHRYTVTVEFTIDADITAEAADCTIQGTETGTGALNTATAIYSGGTIQDSACDDVPFGGGSGAGGGGGDQPPTDTLLPTDTASAAGGPLEGTTGMILWILLTAAVIISGGWVIRRVRFSET